jgi:putative peptidoglycan lipid II flippase
MTTEDPSSASRPSGARFVALGILVSRVFGLVRQVAVGRFFGVAAHGDVWQTAMRLPNALQNLLGEQSLSAAFIPVYARMLGEGRRQDAARFAGAVFALLVAVTSAAVLLGMVFARPIVAIGAAGFLGDAARVEAGEMDVDRFELTVRAVRILFPMTGFMVLASWALGVLNSHRRFFLSYMAPVAWNVAIVFALVGAVYRTGHLRMPEAAGLTELDRWLITACLGGVAGGLFQFAVQLPLVLRLMKGLPITFRPLAVPGVRAALKAFGPVLLGRGVVQISLYVNLWLASFLKAGAPSALQYAVILINLPLGAFGMSVAAAELPELSQASTAGAGRAPPAAAARISGRIALALRQTCFVLCPSVVGYLAFGYLVSGLVFRGGRFTVEDNWLVFAALAGYTLGLLASAASRLAQNTFFALGDTRTPAKIAALRLAVDALFGAGLMYWFDRYSVADLFGLAGSPGKELYLGALGLSLASSIGAWTELVLLRRALVALVPGLVLPVRAVARLLGLAVVLALPAAAVWFLLPSGLSTREQALVVLPLYPLVYLGWAWWRSSPELELWIGRLRRPRVERQ